MPRDLSIEDIADLTADPHAVAAALAPPTLPTGRYAIRLRRLRPVEDDDGTLHLHVTADAEAQGVRQGSVYFTVTPTATYREGGRPTREWRLYAQLLGALALAPDTRLGTLAEIVASGNAVVGAFVSEVLISPEGRYLDAERLSPSERQALLEGGHRAKNYVRAVFPVARLLGANGA